MEDNSLYTYDAFKKWLGDNAKLTENLQTWVFYRYAQAEGKFGDVESQVDSADMIVYLALFYISSLKGNEYAFITEESMITSMLDTFPDVTKKALDSLSDHGLISLIRDGDQLKVTITPVTERKAHHHHDHDDHDQCCCGHHHDHDDDDDEDEHEHHHDHDGHCCCGHHHHHHDHDADEVFTSWGVETARKFTKAEVEHALTELDTGNYGMILRSKGIVDGGADGWLEFDYVPGEWEVRSRSADVGGKLVVIGSKLNETAIAQLFGC